MCALRSTTSTPHTHVATCGQCCQNLKKGKKFKRRVLKKRKNEKTGLSNNPAAPVRHSVTVSALSPFAFHVHMYTSSAAHLISDSVHFLRASDQRKITRGTTSLPLLRTGCPQVRDCSCFRIHPSCVSSGPGIEVSLISNQACCRTTCTKP